MMLPPEIVTVRPSRSTSTNMKRNTAECIQTNSLDCAIVRSHVGYVWFVEQRFLKAKALHITYELICSCESCHKRSIIMGIIIATLRNPVWQIAGGFNQVIGLRECDFANFPGISDNWICKHQEHFVCLSTSVDSTQALIPSLVSLTIIGLTVARAGSRWSICYSLLFTKLPV